MKKITLKIIALFVVTFSYQANAQVNELSEGTNYNVRNFNSGAYLKATGSGAYEFFTASEANPLPTDDVTFNFFFQHQNTINPGEDGEVGTADDVVHNYTDDFNIQNGTRGMMRAANTGTVHTNFQFNNYNGNGGHKTDKRWVVETMEQGGVTIFRFKILASGDNPRYLYQGTDGVLYNITEAAMIDDTVAFSDGLGGGNWGLFESSIVLNTKNFDASSLSISNPVNDNLVIKRINSDVTSVSVYNLLGSKVLTSNIAGKSSVELNVSSLVSGMYIVKLEGAKGAFSKKIIKE